MTNIPSLNSLQRRLQHGFSRDSILRGNDYFFHQSVMSARVITTGASADVIGSSIYRVSLDWKTAPSGFVSAHCTCPHFTSGNMCKHLWAFVLQLDKMNVEILGTSKRQLDLVGGPRLEIADSKALEPLSENPTEPGAEAPVNPVGNWRRAFAEPTFPKKSKTTWRTGKEVFVVLEGSARDDRLLQFKFFQGERLADGTVLIPRPLPLPKNGDLGHPDSGFQSLLKTIATLSLGELARRDRYHSYSYYSDSASRSLDLNSARSVLPKLLETRRAYASTEDFVASQSLDPASTVDLALKPAAFGRLKLRVVEAPHGFKVSAVLENFNDLDGRELRLMASPNLFCLDRHIGFAELSQEEETWFRELSAGDLFVPAQDTEAFLEALLNQPVQHEVPASLNWPKQSMKPVPRLDLRVDRKPGSDRYAVDLKFQYGSRVVSHWSALNELPSESQQRIFTRDTAAEDLILSALPQDLFPRVRDNEIPTIPIKNLTELLKAALAAGVPVTIENKKLQESSDLQISVASGVDWFDVNGQVEFGGRWLKLPAILEAISRGENFVPLADGSMGLIDDQMAKRLQRIAIFAEKRADGLRFSSAQGIVLNSLLQEQEGLEVTLDANFKDLRLKIEKFSGVKAATPAQSFQGKLRKYQREGLGWLEFLSTFGLGGILADDMGLGKTVQCLAFLEKRQSADAPPSLLLAPKSLLENWQLEAKRFTPGIKTLIHAGLTREASEKTFNNYNLIVTTYQTMLRDIELFKEFKWDCVIADEAQAIKNPDALVAKASKLLRANFRLAMTGTPIENSVQDLFSISDFVNPGFLNGKKRSVHLTLSEDTRSALSQAFKPVVLRRTKDQVLKDLPEKTEQMIWVELEPKQLKAYNELKRFYQNQLMKDVAVQGVKKSQIQILAALTRLRQVALHPGLIDPTQIDAKSAKFEVVLEMLTEVIAEGHRILIFSQFTSLLNLLKTELNRRDIKFSYLDGKTVKRQEVVNQFKESDCPVFLMSLKAGGVGLNLVEADYVFLLDPWWNPAVEAQAIDRVHRIGQKRAVNAYRFIAKDTVEEKILELQKTKRGLSEDLLGQQSNVLRSLNAQDIENLFA